MTPSSLPEALSRALEGRYRIEDRLGEGGTAVVFLATDLKHQRKVAVKVLRPELAAMLGPERFLSEIRTTANLRHPHLLPLFDSGEAAGLLYYVMPFVDGESLRERLDRHGPLPVDEALSIADQVASALSHAHGRDVVHRDLKPANVLLGEGGALVADFGVALALSEAGAGRDRLTRTGLSVGTPAYMSPEQIGDGEVDARSDVFALGCLLHEMLSGEPPFRAATLPSLLSKILTDPAPSVREARPEVPREVEDALRRALAKDPEDRFPSAADFRHALRVRDAPSTPLGGVRLATGVAVLMLLGLGGVLGWRAVQRSEARSSLLDISRHLEEEEYVQAYRLARDAERWIPGDSLLGEYLTRSSDLLTVVTEPGGASVRIQRLESGDGGEVSEETLGTTPIRDRRVPRGEHRLTIERDGFAPVERTLSSAINREATAPSEGRRLSLVVTLIPEDRLPDGMVAVPGGPYTLASPGAPPDLSRELQPFFIDKFEVTNGAYAGFVQAGGYGDPALWPGISEESLSRLTDRTGLPSPRDWTNQQFPEGREDHPVAGVTWHEARAFCRWAGKRLPTVFEWEKTARDGLSTRLGVRMPWGYARTSGGDGGRANFNSGGPTPVGTFRFGISPYGAYDMAGNVREWLANSAGEGRVTTGGSWQSPAYVYGQYAAEEPLSAPLDLGFRCARSTEPGDHGALDLDLEIPEPSYEPVDRATFERFLSYYRYDPVPPRPRTTEVVETAAWTRERTWIDGPAGDSVLVYLYLPRRAPPPHQTLLYVSSSAALDWLRVPEEVEWVLDPVIRGGRAVVAPVLFGMRERSLPPGTEWPLPQTVAFRDLLVRHATEMRMALDYALGRPELDEEAVAYGAFSLGAGSRLPLSAVDPRFAAVVYIGGGIDERLKPTLPEADNVNFAPYVDVPKLLLNGDRDEEHPWQSRGLALWNLLREPKRLELVPGGGHLPPLEARARAINAFLDEHLGPAPGR